MVVKFSVLQELAELWVDGERSRYRQPHIPGSAGLELQQPQWHHPQFSCILSELHLLVGHFNLK
jgi:hypothetical protein